MIQDWVQQNDEDVSPLTGGKGDCVGRTLHDDVHLRPVRPHHPLQNYMEM